MRALSAIWFALLLGSGLARADQGLLYREANLAALFSWQGRLDSWPRPPLSGVGFEYFWKAPGVTPGELRPEVLDLHLQLAYDPAENRPAARARDAWVRFAESRSGLQVRLGHFDLPFGFNPSLALRGEALQPLVAMDLGFVQDWGLAAEGEWGGFSYEAAATLGSGDVPRLRRDRHLWAGRLGMPTYRSAQYGVSLLYGSTAGGRAWRMGADGVYLYHEPFTTLRGEVVLGADDRVPVGGLLLGLTQILPARPQWGLEAQARLWQAGTTRAELAAGLLRSLPGLLTLRLHWLYRSAALGGNGIFAQLYYYGP